MLDSEMQNYIDESFGGLLVGSVEGDSAVVILRPRHDSGLGNPMSALPYLRHHRLELEHRAERFGAVVLRGFGLEASEFDPLVERASSINLN